MKQKLSNLALIDLGALVILLWVGLEFFTTAGFCCLLFNLVSSAILYDLGDAKDKNIGTKIVLSSVGTIFLLTLFLMFIPGARMFLLGQILFFVFNFTITILGMLYIKFKSHDN